MEEGWKLAIDIGGTFTDLVLEGSAKQHSAKVLTTRAAPETGVIEGTLALLARAGVAPGALGLVLHGTTLATNALIERKVARTALLTTAGFRDVLEMGHEKRFAQYDLRARRPAPLVPRPLRFEVAERVAADGRVLVPLDRAGVADAARAMAEAGVEAVAVGFLHSWAHPGHEAEAREILGPLLPGVTICLSGEVCPEMREYERFSTTVANAAVRPLMQGYLGRLGAGLAAAGVLAPLFLMTSGGGLTTLDQAARFPVRLVESGPAGGAILVADLARAHGLSRALAFDMGGTTAKICLIEDGRPERGRVFEVARAWRDMKGSGLPLRIPVIEMVEIGAGGGSLARVDALGAIRVGPDSAGSEPGPVSYGRGGTEPAVTDANLLLGRIDAQGFAGGTLPLDTAAARAALAERIGAKLGLTEPWPAAGVSEIVEETMANAARVHAVERGREPSEYVMVAFGGGAPLHAARLAEKLGIDRVVVPQGAGVGSAIGFLRAPLAFQVVRSHRSGLGAGDAAAVGALLAAMLAEAEAAVRRGAPDAPLRREIAAGLRYRGQGHELSVALARPDPDAADLADLNVRFEALYGRVYGLTMPDVPVEGVSWSVTVAAPAEASPAVMPVMPREAPRAAATRPAWDARAGALVPHSLHRRESLQPGDTFPGPAIVEEDATSTVVPSNFRAMVAGDGALILMREGAP